MKKRGRAEGNEEGEEKIRKGKCEWEKRKKERSGKS